MQDQEEAIEIAPPPTQQLPVESQVSFELKALNFSNSEWLSQAELETIANPYIGKTVGFADLQDVIKSVNALYRSKGIITAQALLAAQKIENGVVDISLVEGKLGKTQVANNKSTNEDYILQRVQLENNQLLDTRALEEALVRFNRVEDIRLRAQLQKGESFGLTDVVLNVAEPARHEVEVFGSNTGTDETGVNRYGVSYINNSLTGKRDRLGISYLGARRDIGGVISYDTPVNRKGGRLALTYVYDDLEIRDRAFANLNITAKSESQLAQFSQPISITEEGQLTFITALQKRESLTEIDDFEVQKSEVVGVPLELRWESFAQRSAFSGSVVYFHGRENEFDKRSFNRYSFSTSYLYQFEDDLSFIMNMAGQTTPNNNLPAGNKFQVGGATSVRGYDEGLISGDKGLFLNLEVHKTLQALSSDAIQVSALAFFDRGYASPQGNTERKLDNHLGSVGAGFSIDNGSSLTASVTVGFPTLSDDYNQSGHSLHLNVVFRPLLHSPGR